MNEHTDNIIPFRKPAPVQRPIQRTTGEPLSHNQAVREHYSRRPTIVMKLPSMPHKDIEAGKRIDALTFLPPEEFLTSIAQLKGWSRTVAFIDECKLICEKIGWDYSCSIYLGPAGKDYELTYREHYRIMDALRLLPSEYGRAALWNLGGIYMSLSDPRSPTLHNSWKPDFDSTESSTLVLRENFTAEEVVAIMRKRLDEKYSPAVRPVTEFTHIWWDMSPRNNL